MCMTGSSYDTISFTNPVNNPNPQKQEAAAGKIQDLAAEAQLIAQEEELKFLEQNPSKSMAYMLVHIPLSVVGCICITFFLHISFFATRGQL